MHSTNLSKDLRALYTLHYLAEATHGNKDTNPTAYHLLKRCRADLNLINPSLSPGAYYNLIQRMIKVNLVAPVSDPLTGSILVSKATPLVVTRRGLRFLREEIDTLLSSSIAPPYGRLIVGLNLIILSDDAKKLSAWIGRIKLYLIEIDQDTPSDYGANGATLTGNLALEIWQQEEMRSLSNWVAGIERLKLGSL